jgi:hypothetical protein
VDVEHQPTDLVVSGGRWGTSRLTGHEVERILLHTMADSLYLLVEVVGCQTVCRHCWAQGTPYQAMPLGDVGKVLEEAHRFCAGHGMEFGAYPMHELAAHPHAAGLLRLFADHVGGAEFEPLATTGVPLATRKDWRQLLAAAAEVGTTTVWVAFHGIGTEHDRQVNRSGAWAETTLAIQRVHEVRLRAGCNVFLTTANAGEAGRLLGALERLEVEEMSWEPATYGPGPPQRAPPPGAVGPAPDRRPGSPAQPVPSRRLGQPGRSHRGRLDESGDGRRLADLEAA